MISMKRVWLLLVFIAVQSPSMAATLSAPASLNDGWAVAEPAMTGMVEARIEEALALIADKKQQEIDSLLLARDGKLVVERYWKKAAQDRPHDLRSATKSITGLLVGIAIERGLIHSLDEPVATFFPDYVTKPSQAHFHAITVRHLLEMSSGLAADDWNPKSPGNEERMYRSKDWLGFFFSLPQAEPPGKNFHYCTAGVVILGEIIARASGQSLEKFAAEQLFSPLGIHEVLWAKAPKGVLDAGGHLQLRTRDFLKIGQLMADHGRWHGQQVVPESWAIASLKISHFMPGAMSTGPAFGFLWWLEPIEGERVKSFQARGNGGQFLIIVPEKKLVAAFTGEAFNDSRQLFPFQLMVTHLIPAAQ